MDGGNEGVEKTSMPGRIRGHLSPISEMLPSASHHVPRVGFFKPQGVRDVAVQRLAALNAPRCDTVKRRYSSTVFDPTFCAAKRLNAQTIDDVHARPEARSRSSALIKPITNNTGKTGTGSGLIVIGLVPVLLPGFESPPPDTTALLTSVPTALTAIFAVTVMSG